MRPRVLRDGSETTQSPSTFWAHTNEAQMTRATRRLSAARMTFQLAVLATLGSAISGGCSSGVETVSGVCTTAGTGARGGGEAVNSGGSSGSSGASAGALETASEAGQTEAGADGGASGSAPVSPQVGEAGRSGSGNAESSIGGHGATAGTVGHGGSSSGGMGNAAGREGNSGSSSSGGKNSGGAAAKCGDKVTTPPEFCDDGTNTDLSYGCYACTTLPVDRAPQGAQQCDACLAGRLPSCELCKDYRACYSCLRQQASAPRFQASLSCPNTDDDDIPDDVTTHKALSDRCFNPTDPWGSQQIGGPAGSETRGAVCQTLMSCVLRTGCANVPAFGGSIESNCYCGTGCLVNGVFQTPNGPCVNEVRDAAAPPPGTAGAGEALLVGTIAGDPDTVVGVVQTVVDCAADTSGCVDVCFPNSSSHGGAASTTGTVEIGGSSGRGGA
jgi:hypothetical protein